MLDVPAAFCQLKDRRRWAAARYGREKGVTFVIPVHYLDHAANRRDVSYRASYEDVGT